MTAKQISFIIPVYRSAGTLRELHQRILETFEGHQFEIILVDDFSGDNSWCTIESLVKLDPRVTGIRLSRNFGQHNALLCGIRRAQGEVTVTLDDDLQHPPEEIPRLLEKLQEGFDIVYGPPSQKQHGLWRNLASHATKLVLEETLGAENARNVSALRVFRTSLRNSFAEYRSPPVNIDVLLTWSTTAVASVKVRHDCRKHGRSGYTIGKLLAHAINMMTGFSVKPLQFASAVGFTIATAGLLLLVYVFLLWVWSGSKVPGFFFLVSIISIFSGTQLIALGVFGEYLARIYSRTMGQPAYFIERISESERPFP